MSGPISVTANFALPNAATATALSANLNPAVYGQLITLTATVTSASGIPAGAVTFYAGGTSLGSATLNGGGQASISVLLNAGTHNLTAAYSGSAIFQPSVSTPVSESISIATTTAALTSSPNPSYQGQTVNFVAAVTGQYGGPVTGIVTFRRGTNTVLGSAALVGGVATLPLSTLGAGPHTVTAVYAGDANDTGSTSAAVTQNVLAPLATATTISSSLNPSTVTQPVTLLRS